MSHARDKAQAFTKQLIGEMVGDALLVQEGKDEAHEAEHVPSKAREKNKKSERGNQPPPRQTSRDEH